MAAQEGCLFCGIAAGDVPAEIAKIGRRVIALRDINPQAPLHVLVIPRDHHQNVAALAEQDPEALAELVEIASALASAQTDSGAFRLVFNTGAETGQSVFHVHGHVLAGRPFTWPPG
jgi:histidine triad (HIT) family protein